MVWRIFHTFGIVVMMASFGSVATAADSKDGVLSAEEIAFKLMPTRGLTISASKPTSVGLPKVTFEFNSTQLTPKARQQLDELGRALNYAALKERRFNIAGHTDNTGGADYNMRLSKLRASAVVRYLVDNHNVDAVNLSSQGLGETRLIEGIPGDSADNRRVEIFNLGKTQ